MLVLSSGSRLDAQTIAYVKRTGAPITAAGGQAVAAANVAFEGRIIGAAGSNRYETASLLATAYGSRASTAVIATGTNFADALSGGALAARLDGVLLLTPSTTLSPVAATTISKLPVTSVRIMGERGLSTSRWKQH